MAASLGAVCRRCFHQLFSTTKLEAQKRIHLHTFTSYRGFISQCGPLHHGEHEAQAPKSDDEVVHITYIDKNGKAVSIQGKVGDNVMYLAHKHGIEIEGACEASLACCTCHVYVKDAYFEKLPDPKEEEEDMLDMAPFLKENSRLGCQIILNKELDGIEVTLPPATRNFYVDGHVPQPH